MRLPFLLFWLAVAVPTVSHSQYVISAKVTNEKGQAVADGSAFILNAADSALVKFTGVEEGNFAFDPVAGGNYLIRVYALNYEEYIQALQVTENTFLNIRLKEGAVPLDEVIVSVARHGKLITSKHGNIKVNVENSMLTAMPNTVELLAKLPTVQVSSDRESMSIIGRGEPLVYIDNQRMTVNDLNNVPVDDIKTIEIITNPSAKYEADGRAVVLVTRKFSRREGTRIDVSETISMKRALSSYTRANLNTKKNKIELKGSVQYNNLALWEGSQLEFRMGTGYRSFSEGTSIGRRQQYVVGAGVYYQINEGDYVSLNTSVRLQNENFLIRSSSYQQQDSAKEEVMTNSPNTGHRPLVNINTNYSKRFAKMNGQLFTGIKYSRFAREYNGEILDNYNESEFIPVENRYQHYHVDLVTGRLDFEKTFTSGIKWELGVNVTQAQAVSIFNTTYFSPAGVTSSHYDYAEQNYAAYSQLKGEWKKLRYTAGIRAENTRITGRYRTDTEPLVNKNFTQPFPRATVDYEIDSIRSLRINYSRSIMRPNYSNASQLTTYFSPYMEYARNINIDPSITDEASLSYQYKTYHAELNIYKRRDPVYFIAKYNATENRTRLINENLDQEIGITLNLDIPIEYKIWTSNSRLSGMINKVDDDAAVAYKTSPFFYFHSQHQFELPKNYIVTASGWLLTKRYTGIFERGYLSAIDIGVSRTFNKTLTCSVNFNDIFRTINDRDRIIINTISYRGLGYDGVREIAFSARYNFGKVKNTKYKNKEVDDNPGRMQ